MRKREGVDSKSEVFMSGVRLANVHLIQAR